MLSKILKDYTIILASGSPRRHQFFKDLDIDFKIDLRPVDEVYPDGLEGKEISGYLAQLKAAEFTDLKPREVLITSDTIVWHQKKALGKPTDVQEAKNMLRSLSGHTHEVITSVCFRTSSKTMVIDQITKVTFKKLTDDEITYYVDHFAPLDKAGAYGIQEWIGLIGITHIEGSYFNVVGLPTQLVYKTLRDLINC